MRRWWLSLGFVQRGYRQQARAMLASWECYDCPRGEDLAEWKREYRRPAVSTRLHLWQEHGAGMTVWQFLHEAGFWQWIGLIIIAIALAEWRPVTIHRCNKKDDK